MAGRQRLRQARAARRTGEERIRADPAAEAPLLVTVKQISRAMATCGTEKNEKIERPGERRERKEARQGRRDLAGGGLVKVLAGGGGSSGEARQ